MQTLLYFIVTRNHTFIKSSSAWCWNTDNNPASNKSLIHVVCLFCFLSSVIGKRIFKSIFVLGSRSIWLYGRTKIRCLSRRFSALPCSKCHHTFLLHSKPSLWESNIQRDNFHFYIDFSYSDKIHYHMYIWIVLVYCSKNRECHKIPESNK